MAKNIYYTYEQGSVNGQILMNTHVFQKIAIHTLNEAEFISFDRKDVVADVVKNEVVLNIGLNVSYGKNINKITTAIQDAIADKIEDITGVKVACIDINVNNINFD